MLLSFRRKIPLAALLLLSSAAFADTITVPGGSANFNSWTTSSLYTGTVNNPFTHGAFWNNSSFDGVDKNIGWCLTSSNCGLTTMPGALNYLGTASGGFDNNFYFNNGGGEKVTFWLKFASNASYDTIGWYNVLNPSQTGVIFSGSTAASGASASFIPSAQYGLYLTDSMAASTFYSNDSMGSDIGYQHFAVFDGNGSYYVGAEDLPSSVSDFDYQDMVIQISSTPEPSTILLLASGFLGLGVLRARRKKVQEQN